MAIDSTAELLFKINADASNAEGNIAKFRTLLGKDLNDISAEFASWADKVFGSLTTVQGALTAGGAVLAAGLVAAGTAAVHAAESYASFVSEISRGSKITGIALEDMSGLHFAAEETHTSYAALTGGITKFEVAVVKANESEESRVKLARQLGVSTQQVADGERNILPLLMASADRFKNLASGTERAAVARELFGRGGTELLPLLSKGSEGLRRMADEAREFGLVIGTHDVEAMKAYKASGDALIILQQQLDNQIGQKSLPLLTSLKIEWVAFLQVLSGKGVATATHLSALNPLGAFMDSLDATAERLRARVQEIAKGLAHQASPATLPDSGPKIAKTKQDFTGLADILETVRSRMAASLGGDTQITEEVAHLQYQVEKAKEHFDELRKAGELAPKSVQRGLAALAQLPAEIQSLSQQLVDKLHEKQADEYDQFAADLRQRTLAQATKGQADQQAAWNDEIVKLREQLEKKRDLTITQKQALDAMIAQLEMAGIEKIRREHAQADAEATADLQSRLNAQQAKSYDQELQAWAQEIAKLRSHLAEKGELTAQNAALLAQIDAAGRDRIARAQQQDFALEMANLQGHLARILEAEMTQTQKLRAEYERDAANYGKAELEKAVAAAGGESRRAQIEAQFAQIRKALLTKYQNDLQTLQNSQGWQGLFGSRFASMIRNNEALWKQWQSGSIQALTSVRATGTVLAEDLKKAFYSLEESMVQGAIHAFIYKESMSQAMREAAASTLESLAVTDAVRAIDMLAMGFALLATQQYSAAAHAFTSAAIYGSVAGAAAIAGRAIAPSQNTSGASAGSSSTSTSAGSASTGSASTSSGDSSAHPTVIVNIQGHVIGPSGASELCDIINQAVYANDAALYATHSRTGVPLK